MTRIGMVGAGLFAVVVLAGCAGDPEPEGETTSMLCTEFAEYVQAGQPRETRVDTVGSMGGIAPGTEDDTVRRAFGLLVDAQEADEAAWTSAGDRFATACYDAGWDG